MNVLVNNEKIDVTLENERTVGDVVRELAGWLSAQGMELHGIAIDEEHVALDSHDDWQHTTIESVDSLAVNALLHPSRDPDAIRVLIELCSLIDRNLRHGSLHSIADAMKEYEYARPVICRALGLTSGDDASVLSPLDELARQASSSGNTDSIPDSLRTPSTHAIRNLTVQLESRLAETEDPDQQIAATTRALQVQIAELADIAVLLQQGRDADAMKQLLRFTELVEKLIRLGAWSNEDGSELNTYFDELIQAFEAQDTVLIGDLVEYEILPRVEALLQPGAEGTHTE